MILLPAYLRMIINVFWPYPIPPAPNLIRV
jgi:hypothetical protein